MSSSRKRTSRPSRDPAPPVSAAPVAVPAPPPPGDDRPLLTAYANPLEREILAWLVLGFFALFVLGFYLMRMPGSAEGNPLTADRAIFGSLGAVTLTGLRQVVSTSSFAGDTALVPVTLLILTIGGSYLTLLATALPACRLLGLPYGGKRIAAAAGILVAGGAILGMLSLVAANRTWGDGRSYLDSALLAASAVGNSGVHVGPAPAVLAATTQVVLLPLALLGGLGLPVLLDLYDRVGGRTPALAGHTRIVLSLTAGMYVVGVVALLVTDARFWPAVGGSLPSFSEPPRLEDGSIDRDAVAREAEAKARVRSELRSLFVAASTLSVESRSAGFASVPLADLSRSANLVLVLLMAVGASPGGTGGGLKTTTLYLLARAFGSGVRGERPPAVAGFAVAWVAAFAAIVGVGYGVMLWLAPTIAADRLLTAVVSAAANCGLAYDPLSIVGVPLVTLGVLMALGRLVPILLLWLAAERIDHAETVPG